MIAVFRCERDWLSFVDVNREVEEVLSDAEVKKGGLNFQMWVDPLVSTSAIVFVLPTGGI
jgi:hypothetical protein